MHERDDVRLGAHVVIEGHRRGAEFRCNPLHGDSIEALGVGDCEGGARDLLPRVGGQGGPRPSIREIWRGVISNKYLMLTLIMGLLANGTNFASNRQHEQIAA
ncbi:hypothetical protein GCM10009776_13720 [Microbacterium deminutum]|uniref:Uncharacterized protein n=1 Tax=Microbacterium deminutum TaxID=344164 RepID=A0ABP5BXS7_9MICO